MQQYVLYVHELNFNLVSIAVASRNGMIAEIIVADSLIRSRSNLSLSASWWWYHHMYFISLLSDPAEQAAIISHEALDVETWHRRMGI